MATTPERRALHAYLSERAHSQWHEFAAEQGVSVSAILEALASNLGVLDEDNRAQTVIRRARQIDADRRRRTRT